MENAAQLYDVDATDWGTVHTTKKEQGPGLCSFFAFA